MVNKKEIMEEIGRQKLIKNLININHKQYNDLRLYMELYRNVRNQCDVFAKKCKVLEKKREYWELKYKKLSEGLKL